MRQLSIELQCIDEGGSNESDRDRNIVFALCRRQLCVDKSSGALTESSA